jgi:glycerol-3-phosphate acyltransferase PlsY
VDVVSLLVALASGYLVGSIPVGLLVCRRLGLDPRRVASGRTGGTNVLRTAGWRAALLTVLGDGLKGLAAVQITDLAAGPDHQTAAMAVAGVAAIAGHNWSIFAGFKGGAGTTPALGAALGLSPLVFAVAALLGAVVLYGGRIASLASLSAAWSILLVSVALALAGQIPHAFTLFGAGAALLITWALRPNISRLLSGAERRVELPWNATGEDA